MNFLQNKNHEIFLGYFLFIFYSIYLKQHKKLCYKKKLFVDAFQL